MEEGFLRYRGKHLKGYNSPKGWNKQSASIFISRVTSYAENHGFMLEVIIPLALPKKIIPGLYLKIFLKLI